MNKESINVFLLLLDSYLSVLVNPRVKFSNATQNLSVPLNHWIPCFVISAWAKYLTEEALNWLLVLNTLMTRMKLKCAYYGFLLFSVFVTTFQERLIDNCGVKLEDVTKTISQGDSASNYAPWVVSIGSGKDIKQEYLPLCTGTIITGPL